MPIRWFRLSIIKFWMVLNESDHFCTYFRQEIALAALEFGNNREVAR
jgi:hypothetical protein